MLELYDQELTALRTASSMDRTQLRGGMANAASSSAPRLYTGPQISGCSLSSDNSQLVLKFNQSMLQGAAVEVGNYNRTLNQSMVEVLYPPGVFCMEPLLRCKLLPNGTRPTKCSQNDQEWYCLESSSGTDGSAMQAATTSSSASGAADALTRPPSGPDVYHTYWLTANISSGSSATEVSVDLAGLSMLDSDGNLVPPIGVRYAFWKNPYSCCPNQDSWLECPVGSCPIKAASLPANPFQAAVVSGKCACAAPQVCDE